MCFVARLLVAFLTLYLFSPLYRMFLGDPVNMCKKSKHVWCSNFNRCVRSACGMYIVGVVLLAVRVVE